MNYRVLIKFSTQAERGYHAVGGGGGGGGGRVAGRVTCRKSQLTSMRMPSDDSTMASVGVPWRERLASVAGRKPRSAMPSSWKESLHISACAAQGQDTAVRVLTHQNEVNAGSQCPEPRLMALTYITQRRASRKKSVIGVPAT